MTRDEYVQLMKDAALDIGKRAVMKRLVSLMPIFGSGFPAYLAGLIVGAVLQSAIKETEMGAFFLYIDMRVDKQGADFSDAAHAWFNATPEEKSKYEKAYLESFYNLASLKS